MAKRAGVSPGLLFHYFGSQRRFRHAVLQAASRELLEAAVADPARWSEIQRRIAERPADS